MIRNICGMVLFLTTLSPYAVCYNAETIGLLNNTCNAFNDENIEVNDINYPTIICDTEVMKRFKHSSIELGGKCLCVAIISPLIPFAYFAGKIVQEQFGEAEIYELLKAGKIYITSINNKNYNRTELDQANIILRDAHSRVEQYRIISFIEFLNGLNEYTNSPINKAKYFNNKDELLDHLFCKNESSQKVHYEYYDSHN